MKIGKIYKIRKFNNDLPIAKDSNGQIISTHYPKLNRPYTILFANKKIYYLSVKTLNNRNLDNTIKDNKNLILNSGIYNDNHRASIKWNYEKII